MITNLTLTVTIASLVTPVISKINHRLKLSQLDNPSKIFKTSKRWLHYLNLRLQRSMIKLQRSMIKLQRISLKFLGVKLELFFRDNKLQTTCRILQRIAHKKLLDLNLSQSNSIQKCLNFSKHFTSLKWWSLEFSLQVQFLKQNKLCL